MVTVNCLVCDSDGKCDSSRLLMERDGTDIIVYNRSGLPTRMSLTDKRTEIKGWGRNDGRAVILIGDATWIVLIEEGHAERCHLMDA